MTRADDGDQEDRSGGIRPLAEGDPRRIGPYLLLGRLGAGGMGRVYLARSGGGRTVAVKVVHEEHVSDARFRARFRREIAAARRVGERYTAPVLDADADAELPWVATGYVPGPSLEQVVRRYGPLPTDSLYPLADGLLRALADIHAVGIVHRDLKPSNVMLTIEGPRVIDFGIARALDTMDSLLTSTGMVVGSPGFMSPEQIRGRGAGPRSDVFTLGCLLSYAATGRLPFGQGATNQHSVMYQIVEDEPELKGVADEGLRAFIGRCLTKDVDERPDVDALLAELEESGPERRRPAGGAGAWLPPAVVADLAQQAARLLDTDALSGVDAADASAAAQAPAPGRRDRSTVGLRPEKEAKESKESKESREDAGSAKPEAARADGSQPEDAKPGSAAPVVLPSPKPDPKPSPRKRNWLIAVPVVAVLAIGAGSVLLLEPFTDSRDEPSASGSSAPSGASKAPAAPASAPPEDKKKNAKDSDRKKDSGDAKRRTGGTSSAEPDGDGPRESGPGDDKGSREKGDGGTGSDEAASDEESGGTSGDGGSGSSGGSDGGSSTSGGDSGSSGDDSAVPAQFTGTWALAEQYSIRPNKVIISSAAPGEHAVRFISDAAGGGRCEYVARLESVSSDGSKLNIGTANVDQGRSTGFCQAQDPSFFSLSDPSGIQHNPGPAHGDGYHYERAG